VAPWFVRERGDAVSRFIKDRGIRAPKVAEMWSAYRSLTETENRHAFMRVVRGVIDPGGQTVSAMDRLYLAAAVPTLIVWGDQDPIIPVAHAHAAHETIAGSRLEIIEGVGHFPHVEAPERFVEVLEEFLATTDPAPADEAAYHDLLVANAVRG
jgi:pimeloyl-ACP methyl ester carboxylesterase